MKSPIILGLISLQILGYGFGGIHPIFAEEMRLPVSNFCRNEFLNESKRRWNAIANPKPHEVWVQPQEMWAQISAEIDEALSRNIESLSIAILKQTHSSLQHESRWLTAIAPDRLISLSDRIVALAKTTENSVPKSLVLINAAQIYQKNGQPKKAQQSIQLAIQSLDNSPISAFNPAAFPIAYMKLAEAEIAVGNRISAAKYFDMAFTQTIKLEDPFARNKFLEELIEFYLIIEQPDKALAAWQQLPKDDSYAIDLIKIARSYAKLKNLSKATQLIAPILAEIYAINNTEQRESKLTVLIVSYAPSGDFPQLISIMANMRRANAARAIAWLAIAGEARKANQPQIAKQALTQMIADGKASNIRGNFDDRQDMQWSAEMRSLSDHQGYTPELVAFMKQIASPNSLPFIIGDLVQNQKFDAAQKLIPKPMMMQIDTDVSDVSEFWLEKIALEAAKAGKPNQLMQRIASETDLKRLLMFAEALQQGGNTNEADRLFNLAQSQITDSTSIRDRAAIASALLQQPTWVNQAEKFLQQIQAQIAMEPDLTKRASLLLSIQSEFINRQSGINLRSRYFDLAKQLNILNHVDFATTMGERMLSLRDPVSASLFIDITGNTSDKKLEFSLQVIEMTVSQGDKIRARSLLKQHLPSLISSSQNSAKYIERLAMLLVQVGDVTTAQDIARLIKPSSESDRLSERLRCY
jgi:tetratricopeptide (TPR) repeat protein